MSYAETHEHFKQQARELVSKMTLEEAAGQLTHASPAIKRLNIPAYNWWNEALHGVARAGTATMFPQAIALAAMFDREAIIEMAEIIATEGRAKYNAQSAKNDRDIYKGLTFWSPNINIFRDPRWGRGHETYGEDPYLTSRLGTAYIKGLQGTGKYMKAAACAKHYAVHSGPEAKRHFFDARVSLFDLWDTYLPAFEACVKEADVEAVMGAYNRTNGEPCCASNLLMGDILYTKWGFKGHYVSDCFAIKDFHTEHNVTATAPESAAMALKAGCDLNCGNMYLHLLTAYNEGLVTEDEIRNAAVKLFTTRFKLGLFDKECEYNDIPYTVCDTKKHNDASYKASKNCIVMLKNNGILPLDLTKIKTLGVIGPNADSRLALIGNYFGVSSRYITNLDGIRDMCEEAGIRLLYSEGCHLFNNNMSVLADYPHDRLSEALSVAEASDVVIVCLGLDATIEGEQGDASNTFAGGDKPDLNFFECQRMLLSAVLSVDKPVVLVVNTGSAMNLKEADERCAAILHAWYPGPYGGRALADIIAGKHSPCGKLPVTFYESDSDLPDFDDYSMENRTYRYFKGTPLYPFGFGLSYTRFSYIDLKINSGGEVLSLTVKVRNDGDIDADEITQVYIKKPSFNPVLCGFEHFTLKAGAEKILEFFIEPLSLSSVNAKGERYIAKGEYIIYAGGCQPDSRSIALTGNTPLSAAFLIE